MLNLTSCQINRSDEMPLDLAATLSAVGCALVQGTDGSVKPGTGASTEKFVGASLSQPLALSAFPKVETLTVNAQGKVVLAKAPIGGTLRVVNASGAALTAGDPATVTTAYSIVGEEVTVHSSLVGTALTIVYQFVPNMVEARTLQGDTQPGGAASLTTGTVGVIRAGTIYTSEYDTTVDWTAPNADVRVGANGRFTIGGNGAVVPNAQVRRIPTGVDATLGLYFSA
jgi:hypothetical protein